MRKYVVSICAMLLAGCAFAQQDTPAVEPISDDVRVLLVKLAGFIRSWYLGETSID